MVCNKIYHSRGLAQPAGENVTLVVTHFLSAQKTVTIFPISFRVATYVCVCVCGYKIFLALLSPYAAYVVCNLSSSDVVYSSEGIIH